MPYSIICSTKTLTCNSTSPSNFSYLGKFSMLSDVYILMSPEEKEVHFCYSCAHMKTYSAITFNLLSTITLLCQDNTSKKQDYRIISLPQVHLL